MRLQPASLPAAVSAPANARLPAALLGDWTLDLLHLRPAKQVLAVSEYDRFAFLVDAAPYANLPERFARTLFAQLLMTGVPPDVARRECDRMQPVHIATTSSFPAWRSILGNMTDYKHAVEAYLESGLTVPEINLRLASHISAPTGHVAPGTLIRQRLRGKYMDSAA